MPKLQTLALGWALVLCAACASERTSESSSASRDFGPPIVRDGAVYTPASVDQEGCLLYRIRIPGGRSPAAMAYQDEHGVFVLWRPDRCVRGPDIQ